MKNSNQSIAISAMLLLSMATIGCQSADEVEMPEASNAAPKEVTPQPEKPTEAPPVEKAKAPVAEYVPPFPDREDLFAPPQRTHVAKHTGGDDQENLVELKGFVNVKEPKVILAIDGVFTPLSAGHEKYGVQVISINQPSVVLQRGRSRWTATLD